LSCEKIYRLDARTSADYHSPNYAKYSMQVEGILTQLRFFYYDLDLLRIDSLIVGGDNESTFKGSVVSGIQFKDNEG
jgi:hypothetical protein